jgi:hypothetical protein
MTERGPSSKARLRSANVFVCLAIASLVCGIIWITDSGARAADGASVESTTPSAGREGTAAGASSSNPASSYSSSDSTAPGTPSASRTSAAVNVPSAVDKSETIEVPESIPAPAYVGQMTESANATTQIPQTTPSSQSPDPTSFAGDPLVEYQKASQPSYSPGIGSAEEFLSEGVDSSSPLGMKLRADRRKLKSGEEAAGLLVISIEGTGPAAKAGLKPYRHAVRSTLEAVSVAGAFFFPPSMFLVPILESSQAGDSYDMIIGVDGFRVKNLIDFEDCMRDTQPGETVYLSIVRDGNRVQVPVMVPNPAS